MTCCSNRIPRLTFLQPPETHVSGKGIIRYYTQGSQAVQAVKEHKATGKLLEVPMAPTLKWLTEKLIWVKQWQLTEDKLQALEQLI